LDAEPKLCNELEETSVNVLFNKNVDEIYGERLVGGVRINACSTEKPSKSNQESQELEAKGVFISVGLVPRTELVKGLGMDLTGEGYIKVSDKFQTNVPNLYAVGDLTASELELVSVCASGANAVKSILHNL
jgi:thioredoxin reductase